MSKKIIYILILITFIISCNNKNTTNTTENKKGSEIEESKFYLLKGNISGEEASMYLYVNEKKNTLSGYYYTKDKKSMITGNINNNKLNLSEADENNNIHASIVGSLSDDIVFSAEIIYRIIIEMKV